MIPDTSVSRKDPNARDQVQIGGRVFPLPFATILPDLSPEDFGALKASIADLGILVPILLDEKGQVIDGQHRLRAAAELGLPDSQVPFEIRPGLTDQEREALAYSANLARRHLRPEQRAEIATSLRQKKYSGARIAGLLGVDEATVRRDLSGSADAEPEKVLGSDGRAYPASRIAGIDLKFRQDRARKLREKGRTLTQIAEELQVSLGTVAADLKAPVVRADGNRGVSTAIAMLKTPGQEPTGTVTPQDLEKVARRQKADSNRRLRVAVIAHQSKPLDGRMGRFPIIVADPPWRYEHIARSCDAIENHYPTMDLAEICRLPVRDLATDAAVVFLWTTSPKLIESGRVLEAWGFEYRTCLAWVKDRTGLGYWARQRHELILVGVRGDFPPPAEGLRPDSVIEAPRGRHSEKPEVFRDLVDRMFPDLPKLELFCRNPRSGWTSWGNEVSDGGAC